MLTVPENVKIAGSGGWYVIISIVIVTVPEIFLRWLDHVDPAQTQVALGQAQISLAKLEVQVSELKVQIDKLTEQPYVRREEFENRLSGLDRRISEVERAKQSGR
jgi:hypothetical protein